ncbi:hypothetical protein PDJAM_G00105480 [Pangasius djambal]|uniref:Uncharacterized protein n=1 Tax=Pangasius djambal TaxID=1691987 RepID=A0ACC5Y137_9TELE|nr:hypothetical protein [Pangasius djambal]
MSTDERHVWGFGSLAAGAIIIPTSKSHEQEEPSETAEPKTTEPNRKPKAPAQQSRQKLKKESKKKR